MTSTGPTAKKNVSPARKLAIISVFVFIFVVCSYFTATFISHVENVEAISDTLTGTIESHSHIMTFGRLGESASVFTVRLEDGSTVRAVNRGALPASYSGSIVVNKGKGTITGMTRYSVNKDKTRELRN